MYVAWMAEEYATSTSALPGCDPAEESAEMEYNHLQHPDRGYFLILINVDRAKLPYYYYF
jgi:hypothetical protein